MLFRIMRKHLWTRALAALLSVVLCGSGFDWGHAGSDDPDCSPVLVVHNHAAHRISPASSNSSSPEHCFICHTLRLLHSARAGHVATAVADAAASVSIAQAPLRTLNGFTTAQFSRGPPPAGASI